MGFKTSIIIPMAIDRGYYNAALKSAQRQTVSCEIITIDKPQSLSKNINDGLKKATGEFIKILPDDDLLERDCIESLEKAIGNFDFIHANAINFWPNGQTRHCKSKNISTLEDVFKKNVIHGGTVLYRLDALLRAGGFDESLWTGEEYDLHLRLLKKGYKITYLDKVVFRYRRHPKQKSMGNVKHLQTRKEAITEIKRRYR